jgi:hypothetical protein
VVGGMAYMVEQLPSKNKVLRSNSSTVKRKKKKKKSLEKHIFSLVLDRYVDLKNIGR